MCIPLCFILVLKLYTEWVYKSCQPLLLNKRVIIISTNASSKCARIQTEQSSRTKAGTCINGNVVSYHNYVEKLKELTCEVSAGAKPKIWEDGGRDGTGREENVFALKPSQFRAENPIETLATQSGKEKFLFL